MINDIISSIKKCIAFKSVKQAPTKTAPFGEQIDLCLKDFLSLAKSFGFETNYFDGYAGEVIFGDGNDKDGLAILCHLDVVPEGDLSMWKFPPYDCVLQDGKLYGRGVIDDKGPAIICLYALKELKDSGFKPSRKIKLILGADEESGWGCMDHYHKVAVMPDTGFSPDGDFPVIYAEKGILHSEFSFPISGEVKNVFSGDRVNVVPDKATVILDKEYVFNGQTAHGSTPEAGINALEKALKFLVEKGTFSKSDYSKLFENSTGIKNIKDEITCLTFSPNVAIKQGDNLIVKVDVRYPVTYAKEQIEKELNKIASVKILHHQAPLYVKKDSPLIKTLMAIYNKEKGVNEEAVVTGGGTYARTLKKGVAFGPLNIGDDRAHMPNEYITVDEIEFCYKVYKQAIFELAK